MLANPAPPPRAVDPERLRRGTLVFAGRLTRAEGARHRDRGARAVPEARLLVVGDGPDRAALEEHATAAGATAGCASVGARPRDEVLALLAGADARLLSSDWENLPHAAVEALAIGTPVVATAVGGVPEVVHDGVNGLLVPPATPTRSQPRSAACSTRTGCATGSPPPRSLGERRSRASRLRPARGDARGGGARRREPRVLFVGRNRARRCRSPAWLAKKWDAVARRARLPRARHRSGRARTSTTVRFALAAPARRGRLLFHLRLPFRVRREIRAFRPDAIVATDPFVGAAALSAGRSPAAARP